MDESRITGELAQQGWDTGLMASRGKAPKKRQKFLDWYDQKNDALIGHIKTNGVNLYREVFMNLSLANYRGQLGQYSGASLCLLVEIYNPPCALKSLETERDKVIKQVEEINGLMHAYGIPFWVSKVRFPKQLKNSQDTGRLASF